MLSSSTRNARKNGPPSPDRRSTKRFRAALFMAVLGKYAKIRGSFEAAGRQKRLAARQRWAYF
jgi:hypothetical protein